MADVDAIRVLNAMTERMGRQFATDQREVILRDILIEDLQAELVKQKSQPDDKE